MSGRDDKPKDGSYDADADEDEKTPIVFPGRPDFGSGPPSDSDTLVFGMEGEGGAGGFDYAAFEASLDAISEEEKKRQEDAVSDSRSKVQDRETLPRRARADDATYAVRPMGRFTLVTVQGRVNESFEGEALGNQIRGADVVFELSEVDRITSFGVRGWLRMMQLASLGEAYFVRCSESVVNQITMIHNFCGPALVHSIVAPYLCESCGAEFGVALHAVEDGDLLRGRHPPEVRCPECRSSAEMDEDPWAFLDLDQQLLQEVPPDLEKALELLSTEPRHAPIEKAVSAGGTTRVTFNGLLDESTRFRRALGGIEGRVVIDLSHTEGETADGHRKLLDGLRRAAADVEFFRLEGVGPEFGRALLTEIVPKVSIGSLRMYATNSAGIRRRVIIDVPDNRDALLTGRPPRVDAAWASGGITLEEPDVAADVVRSLGAELSLAATPAPAPRAHVPAGTPAPAPPSMPPPSPFVMGNTAAEQMYGTPYGMTPGPAPMSYPPQPPPSLPPPAPQGGSNSRLVLFGAAILAVASVLIVGMAVSVVLLAKVNGQEQASNPPAPAAAPAPPPASRVEGEWSTGGMAPPAWAGSPVMQTDSQLFVVGAGSGADPGQATSKARLSAVQQFARYVLAQMESSPANAGLGLFPMPDDVAKLEAALQGGQPLPMMTEAQSASRDLSGNHEAMIQFSMEKSVVQPYIDRYIRMVKFQGLEVAETPPWAPRGVRLVFVPTWHSAPIGSTVKSVAGSPVDSVNEFVQAANGAFVQLGSGEDYTIVVADERDDESIIRIGKKSAPKPRPELMR